MTSVFFPSHPHSAVCSVVCNTLSHGRGTEGPTPPLRLCPEGPWPPAPHTSSGGLLLATDLLTMLLLFTGSSPSNQKHAKKCHPLILATPFPAYLFFRGFPTPPALLSPVKCLERWAHMYGLWSLHSSIHWDLVSYSFWDCPLKSPVYDLWIVLILSVLSAVPYNGHHSPLRPLCPGSPRPALRVLLSSLNHLILVSFAAPSSLLSSLRDRCLPGSGSTFYFPISHALPGFVISLCHWLWNEISIPMVAPELRSCFFGFPLDSSNCVFCGLLTLGFSHPASHTRPLTPASSQKKILIIVTVLFKPLFPLHSPWWKVSPSIIQSLSQIFLEYLCFPPSHSRLTSNH